jgi:CPA1 family monovalent cation:H+ antiporter
VARRLPRRSLTTLRAESLINDGTALVLYAAAVGVAIGTVQPSWWNISGGVLLSYLGGIAVGLIVIVIVIAVRRHLHDSSLQNAISVVTPFACFVPAEMLHVSGVVAVVTCGLAASQTGPRIIDASTRLQAIAFRRLTTFVLNGSLFILVGLQLPTLLEGLTSVSPLQAVGFGLLIAATVVLTRLVWANTTPYAIRMIDRRPSQRARRAGFRQRLPVAWAGLRGAVSLAAALAIPLNTADGQPLAGRDLILIATFTVIGVTMLVQATTMDAVVRWARLPADTALEEEIALAEQTATEAGLAALSRRAAELQVPDRLASQVEEAYQQRLHQLKDAVEDCGPNETPDSLLRRDAELEAELRSALLADKRNAVIKLRDQRRIQRRLDREEVRLADSALEDD